MEIDKENVKGMEYVFPYGSKSVAERLKSLKPGQAMILNYEDILKNSVKVKSVEKKNLIEILDMKYIKVAIASVLTVGVIVVSGIGISNHIAKPSMSDVSIEIGMTVMDKDGGIGCSIANQNSARTENGFFYYHDAIAKDLLRVEPSLFEYAFCTVCNDFGANINNNVGVGGRSNIDAVIFYLKQYSSNKDSSLFNAEISSFFADVNSLNDFLVKRGFVDKDGGPSIQAFRNECDKNTESIYAMLHNESENRSVGK